MIDLSTFTKYTVHPSGDITNPQGRTLPKSHTLRLTDDLGVKRLVTRKRLLYHCLFGNIQVGEIVKGEFPNLYLGKREDTKPVPPEIVAAIKRRQSQDYPTSVTARDLRINLTTVEKIYGTSDKCTDKN